MGLELKNISVKLSSKEILKSINLNVKDGEIISLLGPSGCGKSTILNTIAGLIHQDEGSIILEGRIADKIPPHKRQTVIVFQDFRLFPHMTVAENISFPLKMAGINKKESRTKSIELLKKVQLKGFEDRSVNQMSGGQMQRVALARALAADPSILLLDEPFSNLDINLRKDMRELVLELQRELQITTILVTHDQEEALTMSDRIAFMHDGKIEQYDTPENIFKYPVNTIVADYFSDGVYIYGNINNKVFVNKQLNIKLNIDRPNGEYKCLIRPSSVIINPSDNGNFKVEDQIYQGDDYLLKLRKVNTDFQLESIVSDNINIKSEDRVNIKLDKNKLIFIPVK